MSRYDSCLDDLANGKQSAIYDAIDRSTASIKAIADLISVSVDGGEAADASIPDAAFTIFKIASDLKDATDEYRAQEDKRYNLPLPEASLFMGFEGILKKCINLVHEARVLSVELSSAIDITAGAEGLRSDGLALSTMIGALGDHLSSALGQVARVGRSENGPEARRLAKLASVLECIQADIVNPKDEQGPDSASDEEATGAQQVATESEQVQVSEGQATEQAEEVQAPTDAKLTAVEQANHDRYLSVLHTASDRLWSFFNCLQDPHFVEEMTDDPDLRVMTIESGWQALMVTRHLFGQGFLPEPEELTGYEGLPVFEMRNQAYKDVVAEMEIDNARRTEVSPAIDRIHEALRIGEYADEMSA